MFPVQKLIKFVRRGCYSTKKSLCTTSQSSVQRRNSGCSSRHNLRDGRLIAKARRLYEEGLQNSMKVFLRIRRCRSGGSGWGGAILAKVNPRCFFGKPVAFKALVIKLGVRGPTEKSDTKASEQGLLTLGSAGIRIH